MLCQPSAHSFCHPRNCSAGFGANLHSYKKVQQPLADALGDGALVTSHDMPGFGLTER